MAQAVGGTGSNEGEEQIQCDLLAHLLKYNVPNRVLDLLNQDSITVEELSAFRIKDLGKMRFLNAVKSLPNARANKPQIVTVFLGNEEKSN